MTEHHSGSNELRALYLDPARAGVPWLLDPANPDVIERIRRAKARDHRSDCDPHAIAADIDDLLVLLRERPTRRSRIINTSGSRPV